MSEQEDWENANLIETDTKKERKQREIIQKVKYGS